MIRWKICAHTIILFEAKLTATSQINLVLTKQEPCMVVSLFLTVLKNVSQPSLVLLPDNDGKDSWDNNDN